MSNLKDKLTNILAFVIVVATSITAYIDSLAGADINWYQLGMAVVVAVIAYLTGKKADGTSKAI